MYRIGIWCIQFLDIKIIDETDDGASQKLEV